MRITDIYGGDTIPVSYEIFPPKGDLPLDEARRVLTGLATLDPAFVSVTYSAGGSGNSSVPCRSPTWANARAGADHDGASWTCASAECADIARCHCQPEGPRHRERAGPARRPGPRPAAEGLPLCQGPDSRAARRRLLRRGRRLPRRTRGLHRHEGERGAPEGWQDAGAEFFVTQLFFDNRFAYKFLDACRAARIKVPIEFGIMPFTSKSQVSRMVFMCGASLPAPLVKILARYEDKPDDLRKAGIEYASRQLIGLAEHGVDALHIYSMNRPDTAQEIYENIRPYL